MKLAIVIVLVALASVATANMCLGGAQWHNGCNQCKCLNNGLEVCTRKACRWGICKPGVSWFNGCNTCVCGDTGNAACTQRACIQRN